MFIRRRGEGYHAREVRLFDSGGSFEAVYVDGGGRLRGHLANDRCQYMWMGGRRGRTGSAGVVVPDCWVVVVDMAELQDAGVD